MENSQPHKPKPSIPHSNKGFMMTIITFECSYSGEAYDCLSQTASIPTGRVIHQRIVDDDHCISSASSRIYDGPDPFPGRTPSASCRCFSIPRSTKTLIAE